MIGFYWDYLVTHEFQYKVRIELGKVGERDLGKEEEQDTERESFQP